MNYHDVASRANINQVAHNNSSKLTSKTGIGLDYSARIEEGSKHGMSGHTMERVTYDRLTCDRATDDRVTDDRVQVFSEVHEEGDCDEDEGLTLS